MSVHPCLQHHARSKLINSSVVHPHEQIKPHLVSILQWVYLKDLTVRLLYTSIPADVLRCIGLEIGLFYTLTERVGNEATPEHKGHVGSSPTVSIYYDSGEMKYITTSCFRVSHFPPLHFPTSDTEPALFLLQSEDLWLQMILQCCMKTGHQLYISVFKKNLEITENLRNLDLMVSLITSLLWL